MSYYLAPSLAQLRAQINATWPKRSKALDGWIGDAAHSARVSDHNPDYGSGGVVRALDVTAKGISTRALLKAAKGDSRTAYVIHKGKIYGAERFKARKYRGSNPHTHHVHISIKHTGAAESGRSWALGKRKPTRAPATRENKNIQRALRKMGLYSGKIDGRNESWQIAAVKSFQSWHGLEADGWWGPSTQAVWELNKRIQTALRRKGYTKQIVDGHYGDQTAYNVRHFQRHNGLKVDGLAGPKTMHALGL